MNKIINWILPVNIHRPYVRRNLDKIWLVYLLYPTLVSNHITSRGVKDSMLKPKDELKISNTFLEKKNGNSINIQATYVYRIFHWANKQVCYANLVK